MLADAIVIPRGAAVVVRMKHADARIARGERLDDRLRVVGRTVVRDDDLVVGVRLRQQLLQTRVQKALAVVDRQSQADGWRVADHLHPSTALGA